MLLPFGNISTTSVCCVGVECNSSLLGCIRCAPSWPAIGSRLRSSLPAKVQSIIETMGIRSSVAQHPFALAGRRGFRSWRVWSFWYVSEVKWSVMDKYMHLKFRSCDDHKLLQIVLTNHYTYWKLHTFLINTQHDWTMLYSSQFLSNIFF